MILSSTHSIIIISIIIIIIIINCRVEASQPLAQCSLSAQEATRWREVGLFFFFFFFRAGLLCHPGPPVHTLNP